MIFQAATPDFASGYLWMVVAGIIATLAASFRNLPLDIVVWMRDRVLLSVDVGSDDPLFQWISVWLAEQKYSHKARKLTASTDITNSTYDRRDVKIENSTPDIFFTPAPGHHIFRYDGRWIWLLRTRKDVGDDSGSKDNGQFISLFKRHETYTIRVFGKSQVQIRNLLSAARDSAFARREKQRRVELFMPAYGWWTNLGEREPRPLTSVFLPANVKEGVILDVEKFLRSKEWYHKRGIPWRRGYLFHGLPGTGKTSLISSLSGHFKLNIYLLNVLNSRINDGEVVSLIANVPPRSIILLEDIDAVFDKREKTEEADKNRLSFSGLLNALDGAASKEGILVFMTTNHRERLDSALTRKGRADLHIEFGLATKEQATNMHSAFFPLEKTNGFADAAVAEKLTMAEIQEKLLSLHNA